MENLLDQFLIIEVSPNKTTFGDSTFNRDVFLKNEDGEFETDNEGNKIEKIALIKHMRNFYDENLNLILLQIILKIEHLLLRPPNQCLARLLVT